VNLHPPTNRLPAFPWDVIEPFTARAREYAGQLVDLSEATPIDPTPPIVRKALRDASLAPGYPSAAGTRDLREAVVSWLEHALGVPGVDPEAEVVPVTGTKEAIALLPTVLGAGAGTRVLYPELAYPTYEVGALIAGATPQRCADSAPLDPSDAALLWLNSPSNPTGSVLTAGKLREFVGWGRQNGVLVAVDECYLELGPHPGTISVLHPAVCGDSRDGLLSFHSLSKRSNMAGYRAGVVAGDPRVVALLREFRKQAGQLVPTPVQAAMIAALGDHEHVRRQRATYDARRSTLTAALTAAGFGVTSPAAGPFVWATRGEPCIDTISWLTDRGIVAAPGSFYGPAGSQHVRFALTATDASIEAAAQRIREG
jgi:succinyldiaminopimelate transaminase